MSHVRKPKLIEERLTLHAQFVVKSPEELCGRWRTLMPQTKQLRVDLGCGKGVWATTVARLHPDDLVIGIDIEPMCVSFAAEYAAVGGVAASGQAAHPESNYEPPANVRFAMGTAMDLPDYFAPGEIDQLHLNFPTPFPRKKEAERRVVNAAQLVRYIPLFAEGGLLHLKTDSQPLFDYALEQLEIAGYSLLASTRHLAADQEGFDPADLAQSAYEQRLVRKGAKVHALIARPPSADQAPELPQDLPSVSLYDYLPHDLADLTYAPLGMEGYFQNELNRRRRHGES